MAGYVNEMGVSAVKSGVAADANVLAVMYGASAHGNVDADGVVVRIVANADSKVDVDGDVAANSDCVEAKYYDKGAGKKDGVDAGIVEGAANSNVENAGGCC